MITFHCLDILFVSDVCPIDCLRFDNGLQETDGHYVIEMHVLTCKRTGLQSVPTKLCLKYVAFITYL